MRPTWLKVWLLALLLAGCQPAARSEVQPSAEPVPSSTATVTEEAMPTPTRSPAPTQQASPEDNQANADVEFVRAVQNRDGRWTFHVMVSHPDTGWDDYADGWDVVLPDGQVVKQDSEPFTRLLLHPHENEQPFTRSQSGLVIPASVTSVTVRAHDLVHGFGGRVVSVDLSASEGPDYVVER